MKKLIVVVDMQNDFIDGSLGTEEAQEMLPRLVAKLEQESDAVLIFTMDTHHENYLETQEGQKLPVKHCIKPSKGWEIAPALKKFVDKAYAVVEKLSFGSLKLPEVVKELAPDEIELVGLCTDICVISNAMILKAAFPEMPIYVDEFCCAGVTSKSHKNALAAMNACQIGIYSSGEVQEDPFDLERFREAQRRDYKQALRELKNGRKESHWIWYIFPQIQGLGHSAMSQKYAISSLDEARAYLEDDMLRQHLLACCQALLDLDECDPEAVMGYPDDLKLQSSMTLFQIAAPDSLRVFQQVLDMYYDGKMDTNTIDILEKSDFKG